MPLQPFFMLCRELCDDFILEHYVKTHPFAKSYLIIVLQFIVNSS